MMTRNTKHVRLWLGVVLAVAILLRVVLFLTYPAVSYSDTASYRRSAEAVLNGFDSYDGTRTPGYPVFLAVVGPDRAVYAAQLGLGMIITLSWFYLGFKASGNPVFGAAAALAHTLNPGQFFFEANLLTETLATFWLMMALLGAFLWLEKPDLRKLWLGVLIGLCASLATLTRPLFIFMPVWLAAFLSFSFEEKKIKFDWRPIVGVLLPVILLVGGWMRWIQVNYHVFSPSTMSGYHLVQHTGYYFEDVPDEHAVLRDIYLDYREQRIAERGTQGNTIWDAIPAMQEATGMNFYELSRTLQEISVQLILTHPFEFLFRVLRGWWLFWRAPVYWDSTVIVAPFWAGVMKVFITGARGLLFLINLVFILTTAAAVIFRRLRARWQLKPYLWLLAGSVWATSIFSSILDHGDNPRFLVPLQTAVVFWVMWIAASWWNNRRASGR